MKCEILAPEHGTNINAGISSKTCCEESHSAVTSTVVFAASAYEIDVFIDTRYKYDPAPGKDQLMSANETKEDLKQHADFKCSILEHSVPIKTVRDTI